MAKFIFVTGGVVSGLGKGITAASLGRLLKERGYKVTVQKFDPYINVDSSNLSPYQHGEVFITDDGGEADLVLGHYERIIDENLSVTNDVTTGQIYSKVIAKERQGFFEGGTVQVVPHITNEIKESLRKLEAESNSDIIIAEIGGTVGDIESHPFLEAIRQFYLEAGKGNVVYIHVTLVPYIEMSGEQKTKPTQHSVKELQNVGIQPDIIVCRSDYPIGAESKNKLSLFCNVEKDCIIQNLSTPNLFQVPLMLEKEGLANVVIRKLKLEQREPDLTEWAAISAKVDELNLRKVTTKIGIVGKYVEMHDAYLSICEALIHSGIVNDTLVEIKWISSETVSEENLSVLHGLNGIIVPAGFGTRGFEGKVKTIKYAREKDIPIFMIGMGAQAAVVEFARNVCKLDKANSTEQDENTQYPVVKKVVDNEKCFRRGAYICKLKAGSKAQSIYGMGEISERHRHKYEINNEYVQLMEKEGMVFSGISKEFGYPEILELPKKKFFIGVVFRPEFKSRANRPHPLFNEFVKVCKK